MPDTNDAPIKTLYTQMHEHLLPTTRPYHELFGNLVVDRTWGPLAVERVLENWTSLLYAGQLPADTAQKIVQRGGPYMPEPDFWRTDLGQRLFAAGGYPPVLAEYGLERTVAAAILRISRQRVSELLEAGKLTAAPQSRFGLTYASVRARWEQIHNWKAEIGRIAASRPVPDSVVDA